MAANGSATLSVMPDNTPSTGAADALADAGVVGILLDAWRAERGGRAAGGWRCEYARVRRAADSWAYCVYAAGDGSLMCVDALRQPQRANVMHPALGPLRVASFPDDPALPGLASVMAMLDRVRIVRYRPGLRCTLRGFVPQGERFVKVSAAARRLHEDAVTLWQARQSGLFSVRVAQPHAWHQPTGSFWQGVVVGQPVAPELFAAGAERLARRMGVALGELAASGIEPSLAANPAGYLERAVHSLQRIARHLPNLESRLAGLSAELSWRHAALPAARALVPVHGSPHMHQWLDDGESLGLIDFDRFSIGEPEYDLATFLAELDTERRLQTPVAAIESALIEGFAAAGTPIDAARIGLYRVYKHVSTMKRRAIALRTDAAARAERHLCTVERMVARL